MVSRSRTSPVCLVDLVCFVYLVRFVQPKKPDRPDKPNNDLLMLGDFFSILLTSRAMAANRGSSKAPNKDLAPYNNKGWYGG